MTYYPGYEPPQNQISFWKSNSGAATILVGSVLVAMLIVGFICCGLPLIGGFYVVGNTPIPTPTP